MHVIAKNNVIIWIRESGSGTGNRSTTVTVAIRVGRVVTRKQENDYN
jgi:hypothetical protein